jgi:hypothetical protein
VIEPWTTSRVKPLSLANDACSERKCTKFDKFNRNYLILPFVTAKRRKKCICRFESKIGKS